MRSGALILLALPATLAAQRQEYTLRGSEVAMYNIAGVLKVEGGTGDAVRMEVNRLGPDAARLKVEVGQVRGRETLRVIYPEDRIVYDGAPSRSRWSGRNVTRIHVNSDGTFDTDGDGWRGRDEIEIASSGRGLEAHADIRVVVPPGKSIDLHLAVGEASVTNVDGDIRVHVQAASLSSSKTKGRLELDTGSGEVTVNDAEGDVYLDTGSGDVNVTGVKGKLLKMDTGSGGLSASAIEVDDLGLDTGSGRVVLRSVKARDLSVDTGSGSVEIDLLGDVDQMNVDTGSGGITVGVPSALGAELSIETGSGGIDADIPLTVRRSGRRSLEGSIGDGKGRIRIETGSGGVRLRSSR